MQAGRDTCPPRSAGRPPRPAQRALLGQRDDAVQIPVVLLQPRQIHLRQLHRRYLRVFTSSASSRTVRKARSSPASPHLHVRHRGDLHRTAYRIEHHACRHGIEDERRRHAIRQMQFANRHHRFTLRLHPAEHHAFLFRGWLDPRNCRGVIHHLSRVIFNPSGLAASLACAPPGRAASASSAPGNSVSASPAAEQTLRNSRRVTPSSGTLADFPAESTMLGIVARRHASVGESIIGRAGAGGRHCRLRYRYASALVHDPALHHPVHPFHHRNVPERVALYRDQIGIAAWLDRPAVASLQADPLRCGSLSG